MLPKEPVAPKSKIFLFLTIFNYSKFDLIIYIFLNVQLEKIVQNNLLK